MGRLVRITGNAANPALTLFAPAGRVTASATSRTLGGPMIRWGEYGRTSAGKLKVKPGALRFPEDLTRVKLTREHDRAESRGYLASLDFPDWGIYASTKVSDGPAGDDALREAADHTRDGFSFDVVDATIDGDTITDALVIAIGQVGIPAFDDLRIDSIAAAATDAPPTQEGSTMTDEQRARLAELRAKSGLSEAEQAELAQLIELEQAEQGEADASASNDPDEGGAPSAPVTASHAAPRHPVPAVPGSTTPRRAPARTAPRGGALQQFVRTICASFREGGQPITAALSDITHSGAGASIEAPAWSAELWSGLQYESEYVPLLNSGDLTSYEGHGWRFATKPVMGDYAGNKAAIPSGPVTTEPTSYEAARMAVGHDIDRKFYDFPNEGFLTSYVEAVRESWAMMLDDKVHAYIVANAVAALQADGVTPVSAPTVLTAAGKALRKVKRNTRARGTFVILSDDDFDTLMDINEHDVPAFLDLFNIDPSSFTSSPDLAPGKVIAGVKQAATVRTLPGSPIRVSAQNIANGGVDEGFFGYWAVEEHHTSGIVSVQYAAA